MLSNKNIVVGVSGGIACYKAASLVSALKKNGANVQVIMTKNATNFISPLTLQTLSKNKVVTEMFEEENVEYVGHIHYGQDSDLLVIAPATANIIGKAANGIADDMLSSTIIASTVPVLFAPAMNEYMYKNPIVQANIKKLKAYGYKFIEPSSGMLACGIEGVGKLPPTKTIVDNIESILEENELWKH